MPIPLVPPVEEKPILCDLDQEQKCSIVAIDNGNVYLFHEYELPETIHWVDFDATNNQVCLVSVTGRLQKLGVKINAQLKEYILKSNHIFIVHLANGKEQSILQTSLVISPPHIHNHNQ